MRFGKTLKSSIYPPWQGKYIDYPKLKRLLREHDAAAEDASDSEPQPWTEDDEEMFVQELINVQLDRVNAFQAETSRQLRERTSACEEKLGPLLSKDGDHPTKADEEKRKEIASEVLQELNQITKEVSELEKYSRINFTGFLKAAKKHDRKRGARYRVRPILQVRLSQLPFNSEDYSPLLNRLSAMYTFVRQILSPDIGSKKDPTTTDLRFGQDTYTFYKFWVHSDNVVEVKTYILRHLPVLLYNPTTSKELHVSQADPTMTSLYFDNAAFNLYNQKVSRAPDAGSLRLRWTGNLSDAPSIFLEKKLVTDDDRSREARVQIKKKHVKAFLAGEYKLEKQLNRMTDQSQGSSRNVENIKSDIDELQAFIKENNFQPMIRANYSRTAFQIPGNDRLRISLDTNLALIREDTLDPDRPCRDPSDWHRHDIDDANMSYPFGSINKGEIVRFPHAILEIKLRGGGKSMEWLNDLMASHLVKEAPRFSKFVHGVAELLEDYINAFPFWLGELESDIRRDPETAFQEEQERLAKRAEEEMLVGSFLEGSRASPKTQPMYGSPSGRLLKVMSPTASPRAQQIVEPSSLPTVLEHLPRLDREQDIMAEAGPSNLEPHPEIHGSISRLSSLFPSFSMSRYARAHRPNAALPPGVEAPKEWIKDTGPVRVESKVWLANQRTFIKWQHVSILLATLSLALYNAAGVDNDIARALAVVYTCFAVFASAWGWWTYETRARLIRIRSGKDLDNIFGPMVVCIGLAFALLLNFGFKVCDHSLSSRPLQRSITLTLLSSNSIAPLWMLRAENMVSLPHLYNNPSSKPIYQ
jgi:SPX domain protein involved in polyphosphate accumulation